MPPVAGRERPRTLNSTSPAVSSAMPRRTQRRLAAFAQRSAKRASKSGSTRASCAAAMPGTPRSASKSRNARSLCHLSPPILMRAAKATSVANGISRCTECWTWQKTSRSCCPW
jgi:hypothetical protein